MYKLHDGLPQRQVRDELNISIATVTRGAKVLKYGSGIVQRLLSQTEYFKNNSFKRK